MFKSMDDYRRCQDIFKVYKKMNSSEPFYCRYLTMKFILDHSDEDFDIETFQVFNEISYEEFINFKFNRSAILFLCMKFQLKIIP